MHWLATNNFEEMSEKEREKETDRQTDRQREVPLQTGQSEIETGVGWRPSHEEEGQLFFGSVL